MTAVMVLALLAWVALLAGFSRVNSRRIMRALNGDSGGALRHRSSAAIVPLREGAELLPAEPDVIRIGARPGPLPVEHETRQAGRGATMEGDVLVPLAQAGITALAIGLMAGLLALALRWRWQVPVVAFALSLAGGWFWRLRFVDKLLWAIETWTETDLTGDGQVGRPVVSYTVANPAVARAEVAREGQRSEQDAQRAELVAFTDRCFRLGTSESAHGIRAGGPDRDEYLKRRDVLLSLGIGRWRNPDRPRAGWTLAVSHERARQLIARHVL